LRNASSNSANILLDYVTGFADGIKKSRHEIEEFTGLEMQELT
jgi:hypothetical protein